jgi:hypothetical protein
MRCVTYAAPPSSPRSASRCRTSVEQAPGRRILRAARECPAPRSGRWACALGEGLEPPERAQSERIDPERDFHPRVGEGPLPDLPRGRASPHAASPWPSRRARPSIRPSTRRRSTNARSLAPSDASARARLSHALRLAPLGDTQAAIARRLASSPSSASAASIPGARGLRRSSAPPSARITAASSPSSTSPLGACRTAANAVTMGSKATRFVRETIGPTQVRGCRHAFRPFAALVGDAQPNATFVVDRARADLGGQQVLARFDLTRAQRACRTSPTSCTASSRPTSVSSKTQPCLAGRSQRDDDLLTGALPCREVASQVQLSVRGNTNMSSGTPLAVAKAGGTARQATS